MSMNPGYFHRKQKEIEPKQLPDCPIPCLLNAYIQQQEILLSDMQALQYRTLIHHTGSRVLNKDS